MPALKATDITRMVVYRRTDDVALIPLDSPTTVLGANSTATANFSWAFDFRLDGTAYTGGDISARGFVDFTGAAPGSNPSVFFGSTDLPLIAAWWDDCATADTVGYVKAEVQGTAPFRRCVIEWYVKLLAAQDGTNYERGKVQAVLFETWDRVELRYGALEVGGSPSRTGYGAAVGLCADMTGGNRRRSFIADALALGGDDSATPDYAVAPADWPAWTWVAEPAFPFVGRFLPISQDEVSGLQDRYNAPMRKLANNVNFLFLCHAPPLINAAPVSRQVLSNQIMYEDQSIVQVIVPSADSLEYVVRVVTFGDNVTASALSISSNDIAEPDPNDAADWTEIGTGAIANSSGLVEWDPVTITIDAAVRLLRFRFTAAVGDNLSVLAVMVTPRVTDLIDLAAGAGSGFKFMGIAQLVQQGASVHPEWYNRAWRDVARVLADRRQRLFSVSVPYEHGASPKGVANLGTTASKPAYLAGLAPCSFLGQGGATVRLVAYAYDETAGGVLSVSERGGGTGAQLTIANMGNGVDADSFGLYETTLKLIRDEPAIALMAKAAEKIHALDVHLDWVPGE